MPVINNGLRLDANRLPMMGAKGNQIQTVDANASPVTSPVTVNTTATLTVPQNAVAVTICSSVVVQVSDDSTQTAYYPVPANIPITFDCANQQFIYLKTASSATVSFLFKIV